MLGVSSLCCLLMLSAVVSQSDHKERIAVLPTQFDGTAAGQVPAQVFDDAILTAVQNSGHFNVIGKDDLVAVLGFEQQRDLLGCDEVACLAEIVGALNAAKLVTVKVARLADEWVISAKLIDVQGEPIVEARKTHFLAGDANALIRGVPEFVVPLFKHINQGVPLHLTIDVDDPKTYRQFMNYVSEGDWRRYSRSVKLGKTVPLVDWIYEQNQESDLLFAGEVIACLGVPGSALLGESDLSSSIALALLSLAGCVGLPLIDAFDFGSVKQYSPPPTAATLKPRYDAPEKKGTNPKAKPKW